MPKGFIIAMFSPLGGTGLSVVAINLAARMSSAAKTCLVDFNTEFGILGDYLELTEEKETTGKGQPRSEVPSAEGLVQQCKRRENGIHFLPAPMTSVPAEYFEQILRDCREAFDYTVVDLPHSLHAGCVQQTLKTADLICIVADSNVHSAIAVGKCAKLIERLRPGSRVKTAVVLNRTRSLKLHGPFSLLHPRNSARAVKLLRAEQIDVFHELPDEPRAVKIAINQCGGIAKGRIGISLDELAANVRKRVRGGKV